MPNITKILKATKVHYWNLPPSLRLGFENGKILTVRKILAKYDKNSKVEKQINYAYGRNIKLNLDLPINLENETYTKLYSLMTSEGSCKTEFRLHVPEKEFHEIFINSLIHFFGNDVKKTLITDHNKGVRRTTAPRITRYFFPIPETIPDFIEKNKELSKLYLQIAFEAEGSAIINTKKSFKRYLKLSRNVNVTSLVKNENLPKEKNIFMGELKEKWPTLYEKLLTLPPPLLYAEQKLLKKHFNIGTKLKFEKIRVNKTSVRCGKIAARWTLFVYADNINKFIKQIGFITKIKNKKCQNMLKANKRKSQYATLHLILGICDQNMEFSRKEFNENMKKLGYISPSAYLWRYKKQGIIEKIGHGKYKLLDAYKSFID